MRDQDADLHLAALEGVLDETIGLLERYGEDQWAAWLRTSRRRLAAGDAYGLDHRLCKPSAAWAASTTWPSCR